jgi:hypothetical protein
MISLRPNKRASAENAPGPKADRANRMVREKATAAFEANSVIGQAGRKENQIPNAPNKAELDANGVKKPAIKSPAAKNALNAMAQAAAWELGSTRYSTPWIIRAEPMTARIVSNAIPGHPPGNPK